MAEITASMVKTLREKTDAPMMECKKALTEANGDMERAEEILRVKLGSKASKAASRITAEGVVAVQISDDGKTGAIVEMNCETDFVTHPAPKGYAIIHVRERREGIHGIAVEEDIELHELGGAEVTEVVVKGGIALGHALELVVEVDHDLTER